MSRSGRSGLPSGPQPRSRSAVRRYDDYDDDARSVRSDTPSRRQIRPQKSMTSMRDRDEQPSRQRERAPPMPSSRSRRNADDTPQYSNRSSDSTTASSTSSSFLDRMRGYSSSRTSIDDDEPPPKQSSRSMRARPSRRAETPPPGTLFIVPCSCSAAECSVSEEEEEPAGDGFTLWSKVASAASSLTVNVGKAWTTNVATFSGEETPPGQESRLTRAMKAYHIEKARDPSDLPAWLFDERERRRPAPEPTRSSRRRNDYDDDDADDDDRDSRRRPRAEPPQSRGLRDIYDSAAASTTTTSNAYDRSTRGARSYADDAPQPSKATDRLKALRDAKRSAVNPNLLRDEDEQRVRAAPRAEPVVEAPRRRVGLPSGPVARR
ncbi:hypothetical protein HMN09_00073700 [Mycena chlorophos]|uniref:Uncharacterized protein n=1 Tax=Mycena chlorophos TaxID=658473 RepID=A0A8H6TU92_MYCCL|nr:hypothetical protein HMN09_00073700 [Mycena chlorophos]